MAALGLVHGSGALCKDRHGDIESILGYRQVSIKRRDVKLA